MHRRQTWWVWTLGIALALFVALPALSTEGQLTLAARKADERKKEEARKKKAPDEAAVCDDSAGADEGQSTFNTIEVFYRGSSSTLQAALKPAGGGPANEPIVVPVAKKVVWRELTGSAAGDENAGK